MSTVQSRNCRLCNKRALGTLGNSNYLYSSQNITASYTGVVLKHKAAPLEALAPVAIVSRCVRRACTLLACAERMLTSSSAANAGPRGAFIVFEGVDRTGKSTQCQMLAKHLANTQVPVSQWNFPDRSTTIGSMLNSYLKSNQDLDDHAVHLLFSANRWEKRAELVQQLGAGVTIVCDRYAFSGAAYSAAKGKPGMGLPWCAAADAGLPAPDLVIYLSGQAAQAREGFGQERYEVPEMQQQVAARFQEMQGPSWLCIDADQSISAVHQQVVKAATAALQHCAAGGVPLRELWPHLLPVQWPEQDADSDSGATLGS